MLTAALFVFLAVGTMAVDVDKNVRETIVRFESVGARILDLRGVLDPVALSVDFPTFQFRSVEDGAAVRDEDLVTFRCGAVEDFYVTHVASPRPVFLCRRLVVENDPQTENSIFLFSAEDSTVAPTVKRMNLVLGSTFWRKSVAVGRVKRQWGSGFSGSGAQAGATSFGVGSGVGGFPGAGFGGGFSGSSAQAGASSFGTGAGGFLG